MPPLNDTISDPEYTALLASCRAVPDPKGDYRITDFVENLLLTVVDFMTKTVAVERAMQYFIDSTKKDAADLPALKVILAQYPNDKNGNLALAQRLWGYNMWTRAEMLRGLVEFFESEGVVDQSSLEAWAFRADFKTHFEGKVKGLGYAVFNWLIIRQGVETIKPDVHVLRFVKNAIGRQPSEKVVVDSLIRAANQIGKPVHILDWAIWEAGRGGTP